MRKILLDTNAYTGYLAGDTRILDLLGESEVVYMSVFVLGELEAGFRGGHKAARNRELLAAFLKKPGVRVLNATRETADIFGEVKHRLKKSGTPIPINDVWIASHAIETGSLLATRDSHFKKVAGLRLWDQG